QRAQRDLSLRRNWLSAVAGRGDPQTDQAYSELVSQVGEASRFAQFSSYVETASGPGPSPYSTEQLLNENCVSLVSLLNEFVEKDDWRGPTTRALADVFAGAVHQNPEKYTKCLRLFHPLKIAYKYALVKGFQSVLSDKGYISWPAIVEF